MTWAAYLSPVAGFFLQPRIDLVQYASSTGGGFNAPSASVQHWVEPQAVERVLLPNRRLLATFLVLGA
jgi:hypothetical protein